MPSLKNNALPLIVSSLLLFRESGMFGSQQSEQLRAFNQSNASGVCPSYSGDFTQHGKEAGVKIHIHK